MSATPVGTPTEADNGSSDTATWSHTTPVGNNRMLLVSIGIWDDTPAVTTVASVTYNGVSLSRVTGLTPPSTADAGRADLWFLLAPDEGAHNIVVTLNATQECFLTGAQSFDDVNQTTPFGTPATASGTGATISVNAASAVGELVYDTTKAFRTSATALTPGTGQTEVIDIADGNGDILGASHEAGAATVTMSWTYTNGSGSTRFWVTLAVSIKPAATGQTIAVGQALETDTAQPVKWAPKIRIIGQVTETDVAQAVTRLKTRAVGQAQETDLAQAINRLKTKLLGQAEEINTAQPVSSGGQVIPVGQALETNLAQPIALNPIRRLINQIIETDSAQIVTPIKSGGAIPSEIMVVIAGTAGAVDARVVVDDPTTTKVVIDSPNKVVVVQDPVAPPVEVVI